MSSRNYRYSVGIDIGGTNITLALVDDSGRIRRKLKYPTNVRNSIRLFVSRLAAKLFEVIQGIPAKSLRGIGIGAAGLIDHGKGEINDSSNMYRGNMPLLDMLRKELKKSGIKGLAGIPLFLENDANVAAWGACQLEVTGDVRDMVCITLGTGVGGGVIINGRIYHGMTGCAGEVGHITINSSGPKCKCGSCGCLEAYIGSARIVERVLKEIKGGRKTLLTEMVKGRLKQITVKDIAQAARKNDKLAKEIWVETGEYLGIAVSDILNILSPEIIVFCGGVSQAGNLFLNTVKRVVKRRSYVNRRKPVKLMVSKLGDNLGVIGAALLVRQSCDKKKH